MACSGTFRCPLNLIPILFILTFFVFIICQFLPGGSIKMLIPPDEVCDEDVRSHSAWHNCGAVQKYHDRLYRHGHLHLRPYGANFWLALILILFFALGLRWFPSLGDIDPTQDFCGSLRHFVVPGGGTGSVSLPHCDTYDPLQHAGRAQ